MATAGLDSDSYSQHDASGGGGQPAPQLESFSYDDAIVRAFAAATVAWGLVGMLVGLLVGTLLVLPTLFYELGWLGEFLTFGRLRPLHTNAVIFAFAGNAIFAAVYYSTQRLCKCRMWSDALSWLHFWGWQLVIVAVAVTLPLGITQSKEYAEPEWFIDLAIAVVWVGFFGVNFFMTLIRRRERHMYVALWFYIATIVTVTVLHVFNSLVLPINLVKSYPIYAGMHDALMQWWYGHNMIVFLLTMPFLGLMYYFLPKAAERPVFSYRLAIVHFWALVFFAVWGGPRHLHYTPLPEWASTLGMLFGVMLWMPLWGGMVNGLLTLRGARHRVAADPVLKFFTVGLVCYGVWTLEGAVLSLKSVSAFGQYSDWTIAHLHMGALGWIGMMTFGMIYWLLPRLYQAPLWNPRLANVHVWLATLGMLTYVVPIYAAGVVQGVMWRSMDEATGQLLYPEFIQSVEASVPYWWVRILGGTLYIAGVVLMAANYAMSWRARPARYAATSYHAASLARAYDADPLPRPGRLTDAPVLESAKKLELWSQLAWHRRWERLPLRFANLVLLIVVVASLLEVGLVFLTRSELVTADSAGPYTPLELAGRDIFVAEGCYNCHSQMVRPLVAETQRYGDYSQLGDSAFDHPAQWGSRRIGPDLAREGGKQSSFWHWAHLQDPRVSSPESVMPSFEHLLNQRIDFQQIAQRVHAEHRLGVPYSAELADAAELAAAQAEVVAAEIVSQGGPVYQMLPDGDKVMVMDSKAVALISYLQRLGIGPPLPEAAASEPAADAPAAESSQSAGDQAGQPAPADTP